MKNNFKFRLVAKLEAAGEKKEKRFEVYEDMVDYLGFVVMIAQLVQVYYKIGGEWTLIREIKGQKII
jgi:hypothetical protein